MGMSAAILVLLELPCSKHILRRCKRSLQGEGMRSLPRCKLYLGGWEQSSLGVGSFTPEEVCIFISSC